MGSIRLCDGSIPYQNQQKRSRVASEGWIRTVASKHSLAIHTWSLAHILIMPETHFVRPVTGRDSNLNVS